MISPAAATSFLTDTGYAYGAMRDLIEAARGTYAERDTGMAEVEKMLALDEDELQDMAPGEKGKIGDRD